MGSEPCLCVGVSIVSGGDAQSSAALTEARALVGDLRSMGWRGVPAPHAVSVNVLPLHPWQNHPWHLFIYV